MPRRVTEFWDQDTRKDKRTPGKAGVADASDVGDARVGRRNLRG